jgi:oligosaccharide repeat unit polymerase
MISIILILIYLIILSLFFFKNLLLKKDDIFNPIYIYLIVFTLYGLSCPIRNIENGISDLKDKNIIIYNFLLLSGLIGIILGNKISTKKRWLTKLPTININEDKLLYSSLIITLFGILSSLSVFINYGGIKNFIRAGYGVYRIRAEQNIIPMIGSNLDLLGVGIAIGIITSLKKKKYITFLMYLILLIIDIKMLFNIGDRGGILYLSLLFIYAFNYFFKRIKKINFILFILILYIFGIQYSIIRDKESLFGETINKFYVDIEDILEQKYYNPFMVGEFYFPSSTLLELIDDTSLNQKYGLSYLNGIMAAIIPGWTRINKSGSLAIWRLERYYPLLPEQRGLGFFSYAEGYYNFGIIGLFIHGLLFGGFIGGLWNYYLVNKSDLFRKLIICVSIPFIFFISIRIDSFASFGEYTHTYIFPVIISSILVNFKDYKKRNY